MGKTILFSPVGGTDPISLNNYHDGSMLHILRWYRPDTVFLYMSEEICRIHNEDNRYLYCIEKLSESIGHPFECKLVMRETLKDVQEYDYFFNEFRQILQEIIKGMEISDRLLLNVSSGTPAMKSALLILAALGNLDCACIQVVTPEKSMNEHSHKGYDVELLWELNEDNHSNAENRCREVTSPNLATIKTEETIKELISKYDYHSALLLCDLLPEHRARDIREFIRMASARLELDLRTSKELAKKQDITLLTVNSEPQCYYFEYALQLGIKQKKGDYGDFIRAITPLISVLFERILKEKCGLDTAAYVSTNRHGVRKWDKDKMKDTEVDKILSTAYPDGFKYGPVGSDHLKYLIISMNPNDTELNSIVSDLREIEEKVRNKAAHEIVLLNDTKIKSITGFTSMEIMTIIKKAFSYTGYNIKKEYWSSYDEMNTVILQRFMEM